MSDQQAEHARIFGAVSRRITQAAIEFTREVQSTLTPLDVARAYLATAATLAGMTAGRDAVIAMLRSLADSLERHDDEARPN